MKANFLMLFCLIAFISVAQVSSSPLNTAKDCLYMTAAEREMIYEINRVRSSPLSYIQYLTPLLNDAKKQLKFSRGDKNYSLTISSTSMNGENPGTIDTT